MAELLIAPLDRLTAVLQLYIGPLHAVGSKTCICLVLSSQAMGEGQTVTMGDLRLSIKQGHGCFCAVADWLRRWRFSVCGWLQWLVL